LQMVLVIDLIVPRKCLGNGLGSITVLMSVETSDL